MHMFTPGTHVSMPVPGAISGGGIGVTAQPAAAARGKSTTQVQDNGCISNAFIHVVAPPFFRRVARLDQISRSEGIGSLRVPPVEIEGWCFQIYM